MTLSSVLNCSFVWSHHDKNYDINNTASHREKKSKFNFFTKWNNFYVPKLNNWYSNGWQHTIMNLDCNLISISNQLAMELTQWNCFNNTSLPCSRFDKIFIFVDDDFSIFEHTKSLFCWKFISKHILLYFWNSFLCDASLPLFNIYGTF